MSIGQFLFGDERAAMGPHRRLWTAAAALCLLCMTSAACEGSSGEDDTGSPSDSPSGPGQDAALVGAPAEGACWAVPADDAVSNKYWFDDSPQVPCTEQHTTETVKVLRLTDPTVKEAKTIVAVCWDFARRHMGVDEESWVPWAAVVFLPSKEQISDGASWVRCDASYPADWGFSSARSTTGTAEGVADHPPSEAWACLDQSPTRRKQEFVSCDQPHMYEQTGQLAIVEDLTVYPSRTELEQYARAQCGDGVPTHLKGQVALTAGWDPPAELKQSTLIAGACFMFSKDGRPMPPRN